MVKSEKINAQIEELQDQLAVNQESLQNLMFQKAMQQLEDLSQIKKTRKKIARIKTLITEANVL